MCYCNLWDVQGIFYENKKVRFKNLNYYCVLLIIYIIRYIMLLDKYTKKYTILLDINTKV